MAPRQEGLLRRLGWLLLGAVLIIVAGWLMVEPGRGIRPRRSEVEFPRHPRARDIELQRRRSTLVRNVPAEGGATGRAAPSRVAQDPLQVALAGDQLAIVIEAGVVKDSPIGRRLIACLSPDERNGLDEFEQEVGFDPLERIDRVGISRTGERSGLVVATGDFEGADLSALEADLSVEPRGPQATLYMDARGGIARFGHDMLLFGSRDELLSALDRLEGDEPVPLAFSAREAYGEAYGTISGAAMADVVPREFRGQVAGAVDRVMLHVDMTDDLLLVADVFGQAEGTEDLARSIGAALAVGRMRAVEGEDDLLAELLDQSRVIPDDSGFQLEMALPLTAIEEALGECARESGAGHGQPP